MPFSTDLLNKQIALNNIVASALPNNDKGNQIFHLYVNWPNANILTPTPAWYSRLVSPTRGFITTQHTAFYDDFYTAIVNCIASVPGSENILINLISDEVYHHNKWLNVTYPADVENFRVTPVGKRQLSTFFLMLCRPDDFIYLPNPLFDYVVHPRTSAGNPITWADYNNYIINTLRPYMLANGITSLLDLCDLADLAAIIPPPPVQVVLPLNIILYGPPGTGKTYSVIDYAYAIINNHPLNQNQANRANRQTDFNLKLNNGQIRFVTFHQSFGYEEFVEGIRADTVNGNISYSVKDGIFKQICEVANNDHDNNPYILIIDEINRGNISKIFGELITLIEPSKRSGEPEQLSVTLPYSGDSFSVPNNLYIIGTMNTADRSLALIDTALRRRFDFIEMQPLPNLLAGINVQGVNIEQMLTRMNQRIEVLYDREHTLGHAFFMHLSNASPIDALAEVFKLKIIPLLQEYFFEDWEKIRIVLGDDQKVAGIEFITRTTIPPGIFSPAVLGSYRLQNVVTYSINPNAFTNPASYEQIYSRLIV